MTFVLITSSATMASAVQAARDRRLAIRATRFVVLTAIGGLVFLGMQAFEWRHRDRRRRAPERRIPWGDAAFGAYFFLLTGFHGTHVLTGVIVLVDDRASAPRGPVDGRRRRDGGAVLALRGPRLGVHLHALLPAMKTYWITWAVLLVFTVAMLWADAAVDSATGVRAVHAGRDADQGVDHRRELHAPAFGAPSARS